MQTIETSITGLVLHGTGHDWNRDTRSIYRRDKVLRTGAVGTESLETSITQLVLHELVRQGTRKS